MHLCIRQQNPCFLHQIPVRFLIQAQFLIIHNNYFVLQILAIHILLYLCLPISFIRCGGGMSNRTRKHQISGRCRELKGFTCPHGTSQSASCNQGCPNGGQPGGGGCRCQEGWSGTCCSSRMLNVSLVSSKTTLVLHLMVLLSLARYMIIMIQTEGLNLNTVLNRHWLLDFWGKLY